MATLFRAVVMLVVLVGLPSAWVYYGPLPPSAMGVIERTVATAKQQFGWDTPATATTWLKEPPMTAPRFDASIAQATHTLQQHPTLQQQTTVEQTARPLPPVTREITEVTRDAQFSLASASVPISQPATPAPVDDELAKQLEPHLAVLRSLDAAEYTLENWGGEGQLYRFRCAVALGDNDDHTRQFEAVHADPLRAVHAVVGEVTSWQNARNLGGATRWR
jgi:hypothetical protein